MNEEAKGGGGEAMRIRTLGSLSVEGPSEAILRQPKSLALLIFLAVESREGFCRRDTLVGTFWPDSHQARARASLRNALYTLRGHLPDGTIEAAGDEVLRVAGTHLVVDVIEFEAALEAGDDATALGLYGGSFLSGVHVTGAPDFAAWRDSRERETRRKALGAALRLANGDPVGGPFQSRGDAWLERAIALAPFEDEPVRALIERFARRGDSAAAVSVFRDHERRLESIELAPAGKTVALMRDVLKRSSRDPLAAPEAADQIPLPPLPAFAFESTDDPGSSDGADERATRPSMSAAPDEKPARPSMSTRPRLRTLLPALSLLGTMSAFGLWSVAALQARTDGMRQLRALVASGDYVQAHRTARRLDRWLAGDEAFEALWDQATYRTSITTGPEPARLAIRDYHENEAEWIDLGTTPLDGVRLPATYLRWKVQRPGRPDEERAGLDARIRGRVHFELPGDEREPGMAYVSGDALNIGAPKSRRLDPYWLDRREVTNVEFAQFLASGDYPAESAFLDQSGVAGPATWKSGTFPPEQKDHPVAGVSWYEADAYCRWVGKELPTLFHWLGAGGYHGHSDILELSNFAGHGTLSTRRTAAIGPYGHQDLAGNVREWVATGTEEGLRYVTGGAWDTPPYLFFVPDAAEPSDRSTHNGFRCALTDLPPTHASRNPVRQITEALSVQPGELSMAERRSHFAYDRAALNATVDSVSDVLPNWRREFVSLDAGYGGERLAATVFLPRRGRPPYPTVLYHPGADANHLTNSKTMHTAWFDFLARAGYAVIHPVFKGTFERRETVTGPIGAREQIVQRVKDVSRALDYIEQRPDLSSDPAVYFGFSEGGVLAPLVAAIETRIGAAVVLSAGLLPRAFDPVIDPGQYLASADIPLLMVGGELDFIFPLERSQRPYFEAWNAPGGDKQLVSLPTGHTPRDLRPIAAVVLPWLADRRSAPSEGMQPDR